MRIQRLAPAALLLCTLAACTGGHRYGVPRTLPPGEVAHHLSLDVGEHIYATGCADICVDEKAILPIPSYGLRVGLADRLELGAGVAADSTLQLDLKVQLLRTSLVDLAVAPTLGGALYLPMRFEMFETDQVAFLAALPLLVGVRLGDVTLVPGASIGFVRSRNDQGLLWSGSLSTFFPVASGVHLGPGVTLLVPPNANRDVQLLGGLTVALGTTPI